MPSGEKRPASRDSEGLWGQAVDDFNWQLAASVSNKDDASREAPTPPNRGPDVVLEDEGQGVTEIWAKAVPEPPVDGSTT